MATAGVGALYQAALDVDPPAMACWRTLLGTACGADPGQASTPVAKLAAVCGISPTGLRHDALLFALHTYYAILVKLSVGEAVASLGDDLFSWYLVSRCETLRRWTGRLRERLTQFDLTAAAEAADGQPDLLGRLYQDLVPRAVRHRLGEYYTPGWLAEHVLTAAAYSGDPDVRLLDPSCGSGTFLVRAIRRIRASWPRDGDRARLCRKILAGVVGFDLSPLAVMAARANYALAIGDLLPSVGQCDIPVYLCDAILEGPADSESGGRSAERFDYVVGNPPWIAWDNLPVEYRRATQPLWERYGLFSLSGREARYGGAKKDLSMLMLYVSADRRLKTGGRLATVVTQTLFQTKGAGEGFRRFRLGPDGPWLRVLRVDDMTALRPFADAANWTSTLVLEKGARTQYPVPYVKWLPSSDRSGPHTQRTYLAEPVDPARPGTAWFLRPSGLTTELGRLVGPSDCGAFLGANTGGANGVYWVHVLGEADGGVRVQNIAERGKRDVPIAKQVIEPGLLYPLLRWSEVARYRARPSASILLAQDTGARCGIAEVAMQHDYPKTYAYLNRFRGVLTARSAYRRYQPDKPFYSMYNVGWYTLAPVKVVWRRMDRRINAAVVEPVDDPVLGRRPVVPQETCVLIPCSSATEAHYLCAVLNSAVVHFLVASHSVAGGKGFGTPGVLDFIRLRRFNPNDRLHEQLAAHSRQAHRAADRGEDLAGIQQQIDRLAAGLWGLGDSELDVIRAA